MKKLFQSLIRGFLMPGTIVLDRIGVSIEEDGGILRSFINMCFWGMICLLLALGLYG